MMLARATALAVPLLLVGIPACVHHHDATGSTEARGSEAAGFSRIDMRGPVDVVVREGPETKVAVSGGPGARAKVRTHVDGDTLVIESSEEEQDNDTDDDSEDTDDCDHEHDVAKVTVDVPALRSAVVHGSGDLEVQAIGSHHEVDLVVLAQGDVRYTGSADVVRCNIDGSGDVELRGAGKRLEARVHGSGNLNARAFPVEGGAYDIAGSGDVATVVHGGDMAVRINGSGDLLYAGDAHITSLSVTGDGALRQLGSNED